MWTWGRNAQGQLGDGTVIERSSPVQVGALTNWAQVASGNNFIASIKTDGTMWAWGENSGGGQLGDNTIINRSSPIQVGALTNWAQVSCGGENTASVKTDGTIWTWGRNNNYGQLGQNNLISRSSPVQVGALTNWTQVAAGNTHCSTIKTDGTFWTWGRNTWGQLAQNNTISRSSPVQVGALTNWFKVASGPRANHTIALYQGVSN
jgi:alpha-tubulin suppressor-like RCC1 family protein